MVVAAATWAWVSQPSTGAIGSAEGEPDQIEFVVFPDLDTYVGQGVPRGQGSAGELRAGWRRSAEHRIYLHFPLDPDLHPSEGLRRAELWLYPEQLPGTGPFQAEFRVQTLLAPFTADVSYPPFVAGGEPSASAILTTEVLAWKQFVVTGVVRTALRDIAAYHGFEILSAVPADEVRFDFVSSEGALEARQAGNAPRLIMDFARSAFPSATPVATETATPTPTEATPTPGVTVTPDEPTPVRRFMPRTLRDFSSP